MSRWSARRRQAALAPIPTAFAAASLLVASGAGVSAQDAATPTPIGLVREAEDLPACAPSELGSLPEGTEAATVYAIVPEEFEARYRVQKELACSRFDVDPRTLQSDQAKRDNYLGLGLKFCPNVVVQQLDSPAHGRVIPFLQ